MGCASQIAEKKLRKDAATSMFWDFITFQKNPRNEKNRIFNKGACFHVCMFHCCVNMIFDKKGRPNRLQVYIYIYIYIFYILLYTVCIVPAVGQLLQGWLLWLGVRKPSATDSQHKVRHTVAICGLGTGRISNRVGISVRTIFRTLIYSCNWIRSYNL